ncbi:MAG TPA: DNA polymerase III subunit delta [Syntrophomonas sp.]|nr:DNA polymerase III subunit delta [Syntrophomonas sp.]HRW12476.1 DNA polymerase III subunit delta [Syntrophomonas sp.]
MAQARGIYYFWGDEPYLIEQKIKDLLARIQKENGEEPEVVRLDGDEMSSRELGETLQASSLFSFARVVIIKNPAWLGKNSRKAKKAEEIAHLLEDYLVSNPVGQTLVICAAEHVAANPVAKILSRQAQGENIKAPGAKALGDWIKEKCNQLGLTVEPAALNLLVSSGQDMYYLENLIEKVSLIVKNGSIKVSDLNDELDSRQETSIFKLTDALLNRNTAASLEAFQQLQEQGQPYLLMLHMITGQLVTLAKIKFWQEAGYSFNQIAEMSKQKDFVIRKMQEKSSRFSAQDIQALFNKLLEVDISMKNQSKDPRLLMEILITDFCQR